MKGVNMSQVCLSRLQFAVLAFISCSGLLSSRGYSQDAAPDTAAAADLTEMSLEDLMDVEIVSVSKKTETVRDTPSNITVITEQQIKEWGSRNLKDVLARVAGFVVVADRDEWVFSGRGILSDNNQKYLILIDGKKMNSIDNFGPGHITEIPMDLSNVKRIEIIRGPGSVVWGSGALAGVVNIITKSAKDLGEFGQQVSATWGEDETYKSTFQMGRTYKEGEWYMWGSYSQSDGQRVEQSAATPQPILNTPAAGGYPGTYTTAVDKFDDSYALQFKGKYQKWSFNSFAFNNAMYNRHYEIGQGRENYLANERYFGEAAYNDVLDDWDFTWKTFMGYNRFTYDEREWEPGLLRSWQRTWQDKHIGSSVSFARELTDRLSWNSGLEYVYTRCGPDGLQGSHRTYFEDNKINAYGIADYFLTDKVKFVLGSGVDYNDDRGADSWFFSPRAGVIWYASEATTHKFLYNKAFLRPAVFQLKDNNIDSEELDQFEYIWMQQLGKANLTTTLYWQELKGQLNIIDAEKYANAGDFTQKGIETEYTYPLFDDHTVWANASYGDAEGDEFPPSLPVNSIRTDNNDELLNYPDFTANVGATFRFDNKKIFVSPALRYVAECTYRAGTGADSNDRDDDVYGNVGSFTYLDLTFGYEPAKNFGLYLSFHNLTDERGDNYISIWNGTMEQSGRYVELKMVYRF